MTKQKCLGRKAQKLICCVMAASTILSSAATAGAVDINGAFSEDEASQAREYMAKYGWEEDKFFVRDWKATIDGADVDFSRETGYQRDFLDDNMLTTTQYLGLSMNGGMSETNGADALVKVALEQLAAEDGLEAPLGSNNVKYNTWFYGHEVSGDDYPWSCTFLAWCADQCGLVSSGLFKKTDSCAAMYKHLTTESDSPAYKVMNTEPMGGSEYKPVPGDIMFFFENPDDISTCNNVGIVVSVTSSGIYVVEGNSNDRVEKNYYTKDTNYPAALNGTIVHVQYPLSFADGGSPEANAPIIFRFLTTYMGMNAAGACGVLGNMKNESGLMPDKMEYGYTWENGAGYGLIQWTNIQGNHRITTSDAHNEISPGQPYKAINGHRRTNLKNWCTANNYDYKSLSGQLYFLKFELEGERYYSRAISQMKSVPNTLEGAKQAALIWLQYVEGLPRSNRYWPRQSSERAGNAADFWSQFGQISG